MVLNTLFFQELEGALEQEEAKVLKAQLEMTQLKQEYERRLAEKDEDAESMRYVQSLQRILKKCQFHQHLVDHGRQSPFEEY